MAAEAEIREGLEEDDDDERGRKEEAVEEERKGSSQEKRLGMSRARGGKEQKENEEGKEKIERSKVRATGQGACATVSTKPAGTYGNFRKSSTE